jgi:hypothetical protein
MNSTGTRTKWLVAGAAVAGVVAASGLVIVATRLATDDDAGADAPSTTQPLDPSADAPHTSSASTSTTATSDAGESETAVTVDVPRSEQTPPDGLLPSTPSPTAPPSTRPPRAITDPADAAKTYVIAAESVTANDTGRRHHRANSYMAPTNPAAAIGLLVAEPPPAGHARVIEVLDVAEQARHDDLGRIAYQVTYQRYLSPTIPATAALPDGPPRVTFVVVELQAAEEWLVLSQTPYLDPTE